MQPHCKEIVIYDIHPEQAAAFPELHARVCKELSSLPGFINHQRLAALENYRYMDSVEWSSETYARAAYQQFKLLPCAPAFMKAVKQVIYSGHFKA